MTTEPDASPGSGVLAWLPLGALLVACAAGIALIEGWQSTAQLDDSFISYRYARNLVEGHGLVFNPGERVEGITNLLWTLGIAAALALGVAAETAGHALGLVCAVAAIVATAALATTGLPRRYGWIAAVSAWIVLATPALPYFATSGMETHGFIALVTAAFAARARGAPGWATVALCLALGLRPDAVVAAAVLFGWPLLRDLRTRRLPSWATLRPLLVFGAVALALSAFRLVYYGSPLPNTFYAKVGGAPIGIAAPAILQFFGAGPALLVPPALYALRRDPRVQAPLLFALATILYVLWVGGTAATFSRFLLPALPVLAASAGRGAALAFEERRALAPFALACCVGCTFAYAAGPLSAACVLAAGALASWPLLRPRLAVEGLAIATAVGLVGIGTLAAALAQESTRSEQIARHRRFDTGLERSARRRAETLKARLPADALVATGVIGILGYETHFPILDILGLVDPVIARSQDDVEGAVVGGMGHTRSNADYVLTRAPAVIVIGRPDDGRAVMLAAERALHAHPGFARDYRWDPELRLYRRIPAQ